MLTTRRRPKPDPETSAVEDVRSILGSRAARPRTAPGPLRPLSVIAELAITFGVLTFAFVAWAMFLSDLASNAAAADRLDAFTAVAPAVDGGDYTRQDGPPPVEPDAEHGQTIGALYIPALGADFEVPIAEGAGQDVIKDAAAGHYPSTQRPGEVGNFAVAGHRTTYGKIFHDIEDVSVGDPIVVRTESAWYVYTVDETVIVEPSQNEVLAPVPSAPGDEATARRLTITTCHPLYGYSQRYIVHATLDHWVDPAEGTPQEVTA